MKTIEQKPVGYFYKDERGLWCQAGDPVVFSGMTKLFLAPPPAVQQKPAGYALIINGARQGLYAFKQDAMEKGMEIGARFDLLPMYYNLPTAQGEQE